MSLLVATDLTNISRMSEKLACSWYCNIKLSWKESREEVALATW